MARNGGWVRWVPVFVGCGMAVAAIGHAEELRTWADATGRFELQAKLESVEGGNAILVRADGQKMTIPVDKLSKADQDYLTRRNAESPFQPVEASPFTPLSGSPVAAPAMPAPPALPPASTAEPRMVSVKWTASDMIALAAAGAEWKVTPPSPCTPGFRPKSVALPQKTEFFERMSGMAINMTAGKAVVGYSLDKHGAASASRVLICDLARGRVVETGTGPGLMAPIALHDNGSHVVMRQNEFHNKERLEVWSIEGERAVRSLVWTPYADANGGNRETLWAEFVDGATLATASRGGRVALWNISTMQPVCHFEMGCTSVPAMSDDRKWIAFCTADRVGLFDIQKREVVALQETPSRLNWPHLAFSPSGNKIGCAAFDRILVWDTATGTLEKNFVPAGISVNGDVDFPKDGYLLAAKQYLVALDSQLKLWHYRGAEYVRTVWGTTLIGASGFNAPGMLAAVSLPHAEAVTMLEQALKQPDVFAFCKGTPVKLNVTGIPDPHRARVSEALTKKLTAMQCPIQANAAVEVAAGVEGPKDTEVSYMHSGDYKVKEYRTWIKFLYQGKPMWETSGTNISHIIMLKKGENIEGVLRKASEQPAYGFYDHLTLPEFLQKPSEGQGPGSLQTLGTSTVTDPGAR